MTKKEAPPEAGAPTTQTDNVHSMYSDEMDYNTEEIKQFINTVFHAEAVPDEYILTQASSKAPRGYGSPPEKTIKRLNRTKVGMPCYFGTSTLSMTDGNLRNTRNAFKRYHVVVLDDIGTKIPWSKIPESLDPTFKIESSPGNFQLGFVLESPIDSYTVASHLCHYVKKSGLTDKGGIMPCKKVRLPCGVNGKKGANQNFPVKLHDMDGPYWTPQALLEAMGVQVNWEKVEREGLSQDEKTRTYGATAWSPVTLKHYDGAGVYDPVTEWLDEQGFILEDVNEDGWIEIVCPWHEGHSDGRPGAGYSPVGHGMNKDERRFHCFHDHCSDRMTTNFLQEVADQGGPQVPAKDMFPELATNFVYDMRNDHVYNIRSEVVQGISTNNLKKTTSSVSMMVGGKQTRVNPVDIWLKLASCVKTMGPYYDPTDASVLVEDRGDLYVNTFTCPHYESAQVDEEKAAPFKQYLEYLIPADNEREYFIKWLAAKAQHRDYRGPAVVMIATQEGTGRNTLMQMIGKLFGEHNVQDVKLSEFESVGFNEYMDKLFVHIDESIAHQDQAHRARFYEHVKNIVDPLAQRVTINRKYGSKTQVKSVTSFLFFSNNPDALHVSEGTRRVFALSNAPEPGDADFFREVHRWMEKDDWTQHVWNWLLSVEVDKAEMSQKPPMTESMEEMIEASKTTLDHLMDAALDVWPCKLVNLKFMTSTLVNRFEGKLPRFMTEETIRRLLRRKLYSLEALRKSNEFSPRVKVDGTVHVLMTTEQKLARDAVGCSVEAEKFKQYVKGLTEINYAEEIKERLTEKGIQI